MSVFQVVLNNVSQGSLDLNPSVLSPYAQMDPSVQRTIYVSGPGRIYRNLKDGDTFTDCNYWKRFSYPQVSQQDAFIAVVTDDGSVYSDIPEENNFPRVYSLTVDDGSTYDDNLIDILGDNGGPAQFVQIHNIGTGDVSIRINGIANAVFSLESGNTQVFNYGDITVTKLELSNSSGNSSSVQTIISVRSVPTS